MIFGRTIPRLIVDDSQPFLSLVSSESAAALRSLQLCLAPVLSWISVNKLKLNPGQTCFLLTGNEWQKQISLHWLPVRFRILLKINLFTYKTLREKQPVYLHSMLAASILSRSLGSNNDNSLSVSRVKTNTGVRAFHSCAPSLWNNLPLSLQPVQFLPSRNISRHISLIRPLPYRYRHSPWPVDVTKLFPRFCCWSLIWLSCHRPWLRRGYWRYRSLNDLLIDWNMSLHFQLSV